MHSRQIAHSSLLPLVFHLIHSMGYGKKIIPLYSTYIYSICNNKCLYFSFMPRKSQLFAYCMALLSSMCFYQQKDIYCCKVVDIYCYCCCIIVVVEFIRLSVVKKNVCFFCFVF